MTAAVTAADWIRPDHATGSHILRTGLEAASQTFTRGAPLVESSGYIAQATSGAAVDIIGFSHTEGHNDSSAGTHNVLYYPTDIITVWQGKLGATSSHTLAQTDVFTEYGLAYTGAAGYWYVDYNESSANHKSVTVTGLISAVGTTDGWVRFSLNKLGNPYVD